MHSSRGLLGGDPFGVNQDELLGGSSFAPVLGGDELQKIIAEPSVSSLISYYDGILFENRMRLEYENMSIEMDKMFDEFMSKLGSRLFAQYLMYGMSFWFVESEPCRELGTKLAPYAPDGNYTIMARFEGYRVAVALGKKSAWMTASIDESARFHVVTPPTRARGHFQFHSKLSSLFEIFAQKTMLTRNAIIIERNKSFPNYYYQNTHFPSSGGEHNRSILDQHIDLYAMDRSGGRAWSPERGPNSSDVWGIRSSMQERYLMGIESCLDPLPRGMFVGQTDGTEEDWLIRERAMETEDFVRQRGCPFLTHRPVQTSDVLNPEKRKSVLRMGASTEIRWIPSPDPNFQLIKKIGEDWESAVMGLFGFQNIRTLYSTKTGAQTLLTSLNEAINHYKEVMQHVMTDVVRHMLGAMRKLGHKPNDALREDAGEFLGVSIVPRPFVEESIAREILKIFKGDVGVVNEIMQKTSIGKLESLGPELTGHGMKRKLDGSARTPRAKRRKLDADTHDVEEVEAPGEEEEDAPSEVDPV